MASYYARDNVALLGFGKLYRAFANQNYGHALVFQVGMFPLLVAGLSLFVCLCHRTSVPGHFRE